MRSLKHFFLSLGLLLMGTGLHAQMAKVHGKLLEDGQPMPLQTITLKFNGSVTRTTMTKMDGSYEFALLEAGEYVLEVTDGDLIYRFSIGLAPNETEPKTLELNQALVFDQNNERVYQADGGQITAMREGEITKIFSVDPLTIDVVPRRELERIAGPRGVGSAISMGGPGLYQADQGDPLNISGARENATAIYVDGVKVRGDFDVAQASINQVAFMNNGIPAAYGDVTGGVVVITTYNPGMKGSIGKPITAAERKMNRTLRKRGKSEGVLNGESFQS